MEMELPGGATKSLPCRYCPKLFRRLEHVQRHERTHTKEKPFACHCGKAFPRRDLYVRHVKLTHHGEPLKGTQTTPKASVSSQPAVEQVGPSSAGIVHRTGLSGLQPELATLDDLWDVNMYDLNTPSTPYLLAAKQPEEVSGPELFDAVDVTSKPSGEDNRVTTELGKTAVDYISEPFNQHAILHPSSPGHNTGDNMSTDPTTFLSGFDFSLPVQTAFDGMTDPIQASRSREHFGNLPNENHEYFLLDEESKSSELENLQYSYSAKVPSSFPMWNIRFEDYPSIRAKLNKFLPVLGSKFSLPSRHALNRFIEGFVTGFAVKFPFVHLPSFTPKTCAFELLLAIAAIGAQYRFEATIMAREAIRSLGFEDSFPNPGETACEALRSGRLQTIQALLILSAMAAWGTRSLSKAVTALQGQAASLIREENLPTESSLECSIESSTESSTWARAMAIEETRRTVLVGYCLFNLQMIACNSPPSILTSEVYLKLPISAEEWEARDPAEWELIRQDREQDPQLFQACYKELFSLDPIMTTVSGISSLGYHVLIHTVAQKVFIIRQTDYTRDGTIRSNDLDCLNHGLQRWKLGHDAAVNAKTYSGKYESTICFDSLALLRLSYIRLCSDIGPYRELVARDPSRSIIAFERCSAIVRNQYLSQAITQAVHLLTIPVRNGVNFVASTQTSSWSVLYSLCNLESAIFLNKWLESLSKAGEGHSLTPSERHLVASIENLLIETDHAVSDVPDSASKLPQMSKAVIQVWAQIYKGIHVFPLAKLIGQSLEGYTAELGEV
ncbi:hypothetical protein PVAG01_09644 [Phlyctema vagabunda]|uniref:C2H2-type domain-containing protein n=1 Tax=Phlyctema vagabunda TaxID=108571 RepID=A0ABR4P8C1_9HELO